MSHDLAFTSLCDRRLVLIAARDAFARKTSVAQRIKRLVLPRSSTRALLTMLSRQPRRSAHEA
jgi:hypothetical protein